MRINYFCIYWLFIILLAFQSAFGQNEITDKTAENILVARSDSRIENLMKQAKDLFEAYDKGDINKFVELSHPKVYEKEGREKFFDTVSYVISGLSEGDELPPSSIESPSELFEIDKQVFCVVPYKLEAIRKIKKDKIVALGSMIGISDDGGKSWKFVKGVAFNETFPNVAGMFLIPNPIEKCFVNGVEQ